MGVVGVTLQGQSCGAHPLYLVHADQGSNLVGLPASRAENYYRTALISIRKSEFCSHLRCQNDRKLGVGVTLRGRSCGLHPSCLRG